MGRDKRSATAEGTTLNNRRGRELDEGKGSGSGGDGRTQPDERRDGYGQRLGPPPEVRVPAAPLRKNPLTRKRLVLAANAVEHGFHGNQSCIQTHIFRFSCVLCACFTLT